MPVAGQIIHFLRCFLLGMAALNVACWGSALVLHEIHDHPAAPHGIQISDAAVEAGHGQCLACELFSHHHPNGTGAPIGTPVHNALPVKNLSAPDTCIVSVAFRGDPVRAPPLS